MAPSSEHDNICCIKPLSCSACLRLKYPRCDVWRHRRQTSPVRQLAHNLRLPSGNSSAFEAVRTIVTSAGRTPLAIPLGSCSWATCSSFKVSERRKSRVSRESRALIGRSNFTPRAVLAAANISVESTKTPMRDGRSRIAELKLSLRRGVESIGKSGFARRGHRTNLKKPMISEVVRV
jgi:hypothetical protein